METPSQRLEAQTPQPASSPGRRRGPEPFPYSEAFRPKTFVAPASSRELTRKSKNGYGVVTSQLSTAYIGAKNKAENPHRAARTRAARTPAWTTRGREFLVI